MKRVNHTQEEWSNFISKQLEMEENKKKRSGITLWISVTTLIVLINKFIKIIYLIDEKESGIFYAVTLLLYSLFMIFIIFSIYSLNRNQHDIITRFTPVHKFNFISNRFFILLVIYSYFCSVVSANLKDYFFLMFSSIVSLIVFISTMFNFRQFSLKKIIKRKGDFIFKILDIVFMKKLKIYFLVLSIILWFLNIRVAAKILNYDIKTYLTEDILLGSLLFIITLNEQI